MQENVLAKSPLRQAMCGLMNLRLFMLLCMVGRQGAIGTYSSFERKVDGISIRKRIRLVKIAGRQEIVSVIHSCAQVNSRALCRQCSWL